jgi:hypothetical protein
MASELDDLRSFLEQRISAAYPNLDVSAGSVADVEIITPTIERLAPDPFDSPIEDFLRGRLRSEFPDLVLQRGEPIDEIAVKPNRIFLEPFRRQISAVSRNQSLQDPTVLNDREADALAANYFSRRQRGAFSVGVARLYYSAPRFSLIQPTNAVYTQDGLRFLPVESQAITADDMVFNQSGSLFFFDVICRAEKQGEEYNIERTQLIGIEGAPEVVKVENRIKFEEGGARETTSEFLARVEQELTEKSLVTFRGIRARVLKLFESVRSITVIGYNDPEMQRDIITGAPDSAYGFGMLSGDTPSSTFSIGAGFVADGTSGSDDFVKIGVEIGDVFRTVDATTGVFSEFTVVEVVSSVQVRVTPPPPTLGLVPVVLIGPRRGTLTLSDIPGGIVQPVTANGEILVQNNQVHIGGVFDTFIRAGDPTDRSIELTAVRDASPLHFGVDLEPFGNDSDEFVQITERIQDAATTDQAWAGPGDASAIIYIKVYDSGDFSTPWKPTAEDVGRYLELLGTDGAGSDYGLYVIQAVGEEQVFETERAIPVTVSMFDQHTQSNLIATISDRVAASGPGAASYDLDFRLVEKVSVKSRVRDRDNPQADFNGGPTEGLGAEVGDSVVLENGPDAGIYSIRRILTSIGEDDTLVLDRELTSSTPKPDGAGTGSGLRYRVADELQVNLIDPRVTKMPLGEVFPADDLQTVANDPTVTVGGSSNFLLAGVEAGDTLEILEGANAGRYEIQTPVQGTQLEVLPAPPTTAFNQEFSVYRAFTGASRPLVRVSAVELLDSANQPTGITVPYGKEIDARVLGTFANRAGGLNVESFTGEVLSTELFEDTTVDFEQQGVARGDRLEILEGQNIGEYEILEIGLPLPSGQLRIVSTPGTPGANDFVGPEAELHYRIGQPSAGIVRLFFLEPTSVEVATGTPGGRLRYIEGGQDISFRFSQVQGRLVIPAPGSGDDDPRDLRVVRNVPVGGGDFNTILEITDTANPDVFEAELLEGDLLEVQEQIRFRDSGAVLLEDLGIFGTPAGLRTVTGSNQVSVPSNSHIDFTQMEDLQGQTLAINSGPDEGVYIIERVVDEKTLQLNAVMTGTTVSIQGRETALPLYDATVEEIAGDHWLRDLTDSGQLPEVGDYVTIFEATTSTIEGTYEVLAKDVPAKQVQLSGFPATGPFPWGGLTTPFAWISTDNQTLGGVLEQPFTIYQTVGKELEILEVATKALEVTALGTGAVQGGLTTFLGAAGAFFSVVRGDRLEILAGPNAGVYPVLSVTAGNLITVYTAHPFSAVSTADQYRVWAGVHGSRRMLTVGPFEGSDGKVDPGQQLIYRIRRPGIFRLSSTEMEENQDASGLYYADLNVESLGPGDDRNLAEDSRLTVESGLQADGYTYTVENNVLTFSMFEEVRLNFDRRFLPVGNTDLPENRTEINGRNLQIRYETSTTVQLIDDLLRSDQERPVNANPIARHFLPSFVFTQLTYSGGSSTQVTGPELEDYINNLGPLDQLEVSDLEAVLTQRGANSIRHPIVLVSVTHDINRNLVVERSEDAIGGDVVPYEGSARISSFFATLNEGLIVTRQ